MGPRLFWLLPAGSLHSEREGAPAWSLCCPWHWRTSRAAPPPPPRVGRVPLSVPHTRRCEWPAGWHHPQRGSMCPVWPCKWVWCLLCHLPILHQIIFLHVFRNIAAHYLVFPPATSASRGGNRHCLPRCQGHARPGLRGALGPPVSRPMRPGCFPGLFPARTRACSSRKFITGWGRRSLCPKSKSPCVNGPPSYPPAGKAEVIGHRLKGLRQAHASSGSKACAGGTWAQVPRMFRAQ